MSNRQAWPARRHDEQVLLLFVPLCSVLIFPFPIYFYLSFPSATVLNIACFDLEMPFTLCHCIKMSAMMNVGLLSTCMSARPTFGFSN